MQKLLKVTLGVSLLLVATYVIFVLNNIQTATVPVRDAKQLKTPWPHPVIRDTASPTFKSATPISAREKTTARTAELAENTVDGHSSLNDSKSTFPAKTVHHGTTPTLSLSDALSDVNDTDDVNADDVIYNKTDDVIADGNQKYLIYVCDRKRSCGGWGDRQRGLVGVFVLALVTGRRFGINMSVPCDVTHFYVPSGHIDWVIPDSEVSGKTSTWLDDMGSGMHLTSRLGSMDFNKEFPQDVVFIRTNGEYNLGVRNNKWYKALIPEWATGSSHRTFHFAWQKLMTPTPHLQSHVDKIMDGISFKSRKQPLVCAHVRVGRSETIKRDTEIRFNMTHLPILWDFVAKWVNNGSRLFLATDSWAVRNLTREHFGKSMFDSGGQITHVDQHRGLPSSCVGFESALVDQLVLTQCDVLVTSNSIFSSRASYMRNTTDNVFAFLKGKLRETHLKF